MIMTVLEQIKKILRSRKFWVLVAALLATLAAFCTHQIDVWQTLQAGVAALAVYSTGVAIEDSGNGSKTQS
jgi:Mg/Co/Ni transporter MgtE